jgi:hypothetical protein
MLCFALPRTQRVQGHLSQKDITYPLLLILLEGLQAEEWYKFKYVLERLISILELLFDRAYVWFLETHIIWSNIMKNTLWRHNLPGAFLATKLLSSPCLPLQ